MKRLRNRILAVWLAIALLVGSVVSGALTRPAQAIDLGDILKIGGVILVVSVFGDQINSFINNALGQREAESVGATKVVPIFSVGQGAYIGAAQVVGLPANVRLVQGVAAIQVNIGQIDGTGLIPISTKRPGRTIDRVGGVGVGAIIDLRI